MAATTGALEAFAVSALAAAATLAIPLFAIGLIGYALYKLVGILQTIDWQGILSTISQPFVEFATYIQSIFENAVDYIKDKWSKG